MGWKAGVRAVAQKKMTVLFGCLFSLFIKQLFRRDHFF